MYINEWNEMEASVDKFWKHTYILSTYVQTRLTTLAQTM
jgi:hypothetical protein